MLSPRNKGAPEPPSSESPPSESDLQHRPRYTSRPTGLVVDAFKAHIWKTGSPETFETISTTAPPLEGDLVVLTDFHIERSRRSAGDLAPCPICSPTSPKYLDGWLIWCKASRAIYAIGPECGATLWRDGRLDREIATMRRQQLERRTDDALERELPLAPAFLAWIAAHLASAGRADHLAREFRREAPQIHRRLLSITKVDGLLTVDRRILDEEGRERYVPETIARLRGTGFLNASFGAVGRMRIQQAALERLAVDDDEEARFMAICEMTSRDRAGALTAVRDAGRKLVQVRRHIADALEFLSTPNLQALDAWGRGPEQAMPLTASLKHGQVEIRSDAKNLWWGSLSGLSVPGELPGAHDDGS